MHYITDVVHDRYVNWYYHAAYVSNLNIEIYHLSINHIDPFNIINIKIKN